jgi:hypothetical protein
MAGITITKDGQIRRYEWFRTELSQAYVSSGAKIYFWFNVYNTATNALLWTHEVSRSGAAAVTLYNALKTTGISNYYVELCIDLNVSSAGVPANMESEVVA